MDFTCDPVLALSLLNSAINDSFWACVPMSAEGTVKQSMVVTGLAGTAVSPAGMAVTAGAVVAAGAAAPQAAAARVCGRLQPTLAREFRRQNAVVAKCQIVMGHPQAEGVHPKFGRRAAIWAGDEDDMPVALGGQVVDRLADAADRVGSHAIEGLGLFTVANDDHWTTQADEFGSRDADGVDDYAVEVIPAGKVKILPLALRVPVCIGKQHGISPLIRDILDTSNDFGEERVGDVRDDNAQGKRALAAQYPGEDARLVISRSAVRTTFWRAASLTSPSPRMPRLTVRLDTPDLVAMSKIVIRFEAFFMMGWERSWAFPINAGCGIVSTPVFSAGRADGHAGISREAANAWIGRDFATSREIPALGEVWSWTRPTLSTSRLCER